MIKIKPIRGMIFLFAALLSTGVFSGCGENSTPVTINDGNDLVLDGSTQTNEDTPTVNDTEDKVIQKGWYVKLTVQSDSLKDNSTVLGYLEGASDSKDRYDSEALSSTGLYSTIYHEDFGSTKNYRSDYRTYKAVGEKSDTWMIQINSGDANADVTLSWNGITYVTKSLKGGFDEEVKIESPELSLMRLVDMETGNVMPATDEGMKVTFNMNGSHQRTFEWVLLADGEAEPDVQPIEKSTGISAKSMKVQTNEEEAVNDEFTPPSFEKR